MGERREIQSVLSPEKVCNALGPPYCQKPDPLCSAPWGKLVPAA